MYVTKPTTAVDSWNLITEGNIGKQTRTQYQLLHPRSKGDGIIFILQVRSVMV